MTIANLLGRIEEGRESRVGKKADEASGGAGPGKSKGEGLGEDALLAGTEKDDIPVAKIEFKSKRGSWLGAGSRGRKPLLRTSEGSRPRARRVARIPAIAGDSPSLGRTRKVKGK